MKNILLLLGLIALVGCSKAGSEAGRHWEYKVVEVENDKFKEMADAFKEKPVDENRVELLAGLPGNFDFNAKPEESLDELGKQGWELVAAIPQTETEFDTGLPKANVRTGVIILIFKR